MILPILGHAALVATCAGAAAGIGPLPRSTLAMRVGQTWHEWWRSERAPSRFDVSATALAPAIRWKPGTDGVEWAEEALSGSGEAWRTALLLVRLDPRRVRLVLDTAFSRGTAGWNVSRVAPRAVAALNAGQFVRSMPWGWVVLDGLQFLAPSVAPLVTTFTISRDGETRFTHGVLPDSSGVRWAFQSYPTLLNDGTVPVQLRNAGCGVDVAHRDARLAIGRDASGWLLVALTRFAALGGALGGALGRVPFGLTTPEMAAVMGALGATDAVLLDGGISAQLLVRDAGGATRQWPGVRNVPLALVAYPK